MSNDRLSLFRLFSENLAWNPQQNDGWTSLSVTQKLAYSPEIKEWEMFSWNNPVSLFGLETGDRSGVNIAHILHGQSLAFAAKRFLGGSGVKPYSLLSSWRANLNIKFYTRIIHITLAQLQRHLLSRNEKCSRTQCVRIKLENDLKQLEIRIYTIRSLPNRNQVAPWVQSVSVQCGSQLWRETRGQPRSFSLSYPQVLCSLFFVIRVSWIGNVIQTANPKFAKGNPIGINPIRLGW